jgi:hypothetical protein
VTSKPPAEIQTLIDGNINGFNNQDNDLFLSVFGNTAIIIDGIAPYRWPNPNAPANWLADVAKWREDLGVTYETPVLRNGLLECGGIIRLCGHLGNSDGHDQGAVRRSYRYSGIHVRETRWRLED